MAGMPQNFIGGDREQVLLMPPSLQEWLPQDHLAWFVLAAVEEMDLAAFYAVYRGDGVGRPAHDPGVMVALLLYAYSRGQRSSRHIERACVEDVACRVICVNEAPDHTTIARFRQRHEDAIAGLFSDVLRLCADAGLAGVGLVAVDGTKVHADASHHANRDYEQIAREILAEADAVDALEDERFGDRRGDELPLELQTGRGRKEWLRAGRKRLEAQRDADAKPIPASRPERLKESKRRLQDELWAEICANEQYLAYRARGVMSNGRRLGPSTVPKSWVAPEVPTGKINVTDPDSRNVKTPRGYLQGYNAQAVCNEQQIVIAAEISGDSPDFGHLGPMITAAQRELHAAGITEPLEVVVADTGYWHQVQMDELAMRDITVLIPPDTGKRIDTRPGWDGGRYAFMRRVLGTDIGAALYAKRQELIEPVFANTKFNRRIDRFQRRGRSACRSEWRLINATHNLLKLHKHHISPAAA
jgi:transposase